MARFSWNGRSAVGRRRAARRVSRSSSATPSSAGREATLQPSRSISSPRSPFCHACLKVRPMAMVSPTAFICTPSVFSAVGNFSKAKRGNFTTT